LNPSSPCISIIFKDISDNDKRDAGPQLTKVLDFKRKFTEEFRGAYQTFNSLREFEQRFRSILASTLSREREEDDKGDNEEKSKSILGGNSEIVHPASDAETFFSSQALDFLNDLISRPTDAEASEYTSTEAARFRLIGKTLHHSGNDEDTLGAHDANLMFLELAGTELGAEERRGLLDTGLQGFETENIPFWKWAVSQESRSIVSELAFRTIVGGEKKRSNALKALTILDENLRGVTGSFSREELRDFWLMEENGESVKLSALRFLGELGDSDDLGHIERHIDSSEATVAKAALSAKVQFLARMSITEALEFLSGREDADVPQEVIEEVEAKLSVFETTVLEGCLATRSTGLQLIVSTELLRRGALDDAGADLLAMSSDSEVRLIAAHAKHDSKQDFSLKDAHSLIVQPRTRGTFVFGNTDNRDWPGEEAYERYKHNYLSEKSYEELVKLRKDESVYEHDINFAIFDKYFRRVKPAFCDALRNEFEEFLNEKLEIHPNPSSLPNERIQRFLRNNMLQEGLEILCRRGTKAELKLVREILDDSDFEYDDAVISFLAKFGDFTDVDRIIRISRKPKHFELSLLSIGGKGVSFDKVGKVVLKLASKRIGDLLVQDMSIGLWTAVIRHLSKTEFSSLGDDRLCSWLSDRDERKRKAVALKIIICLPKTRIKAIWKAYGQGQDRYFYNVAHWLDMGVSLGRAQSTAAAKKLMNSL
jgi:HEAT repeat protein